MNVLKYLIVPIAFIFLFADGYGQNNWTLQKEKDGIKISSRPSATSSFNDIHVEVDVPGNLKQLSGILLDIGKYPDWAYATRKSVLIKQISPTQLIYYSEIDVPWPATDRFFYAAFEIKQDPASHSMQVISESIPDYKPVPKDLVVVPFSRGTWNVKIISPNTMHIDYILELNPGNSMPAWIINLFATKGPFETFTNIRRKMMALNP